MIATFAGAEETGAQVADAAAETTAEETVLTDEVVPVFVSEEVVQELPEEASPEYIGDVPAAANNLRRAAEQMSQLQQDRGRLIRLCIEPEPGCAIQRSGDLPEQRRRQGLRQGRRRWSRPASGG